MSDDFWMVRTGHTLEPIAFGSGTEAGHTCGRTTSYAEELHTIGSISLRTDCEPCSKIIEAWRAVDGAIAGALDDWDVREVDA